MKHETNDSFLNPVKKSPQKLTIIDKFRTFWRKTNTR